VTADDAADTVYARYRTPSAGWSAESGALSRTGSGTITIPSLTNGTRYQFAIYTKNNTLYSEWDFSSAVPTSDSITPTDLDTDLIPEILSIVTEFGRTVIFTVYGSEAYNTATGAVTKSGASTYSKKVTPPEGYEEKLVDNTVIKRGDKRIYLPASGLEFTPTKMMEVKIGDVNWRIQDVKPIYTGEQVGLYELQIRN